MGEVGVTSRALIVAAEDLIARSRLIRQDSRRARAACRAIREPATVHPLARLDEARNDVS